VKLVTLMEIQAVASVAGGSRRAGKNLEIPREKRRLPRLVTPIDDNYSDMDN